jgi:hypothetical protein
MYMNMLSETSTEILPPNPIRVETALSRYPVHRLAKHGDIVIDIRLADEHGEASIKWEVTHNSKYGQPGPLAYKLDTLIINRRIEEAVRPIPNIIRLGTLKEICRQLDSVECGQNTNRIKSALYQNAFAAITAKIRYKTVSKTADVPDAERTIEFGDTRYGVVFTGETLPDGRTADAVYIVLHEFYREILDNAKTRPLDYDYLKGLNPASQRFYELLSYQMYAAIKNSRPWAKLSYSEFCTYAPLVRQFDWDVVRPQLARIHAPHKASGYIADVAYEQAVDNDGRPDWIMLYQPGPKARSEYRAFAKRGGPVILQTEPFTDALPPRLAGPDPSPLEAELIGRGITPRVAAALVRDHGEEKVRAQGEVLDWYLAKKPGKIDEPAAWLVSAIKSPTGHAVPKGFMSKAERDQQVETKRQSAARAAEERRRKRAEAAEEKAEMKRAAEYWASLTPEGRAEVDAASIAAADPASLAAEAGPLKGAMQRARREEYIRRQLADRG